MFIINNFSVEKKKKHFHIVHALKLTLQRPKCPFTSHILLSHKQQNLTCSFIYRQDDKECHVFLWKISNEAKKSCKKVLRKPPVPTHNSEIMTHT